MKPTLLGARRMAVGAAVACRGDPACDDDPGHVASLRCPNRASVRA